MSDHLPSDRLDALLSAFVLEGALTGDQALRHAEMFAAQVQIPCAFPLLRKARVREFPTSEGRA